MHCALTRTPATLIAIGILSFSSLLVAQKINSQPSASAVPISIPYESTQDGLLTLLIEDEHGNRVKNLVADYPVHTGHNTIPWDGSSLNGVALPGRYRISGLFHQRIVPRLQYSIYSPGTPPWPTADGTGAWLADHTAPASALFLPEGSPWPTHSTQPEILLGAQAAEAGHALMWTDLNGRKLDGIKIRGWNGGVALARDIGPNRNPDHVAYTVYVVNPSRDFGKTDPGALQVYIFTKSGLTPLEKVVGGIQIHDAFRELVGLGAFNGLLLLSNPAANEIIAFDVRHNAQVSFAKIKLPHLGSLSFEPDGHLLVTTDGAITRFTVVNDWRSLQLTNPQIIVPASALESPKQIIESDREIYVTDWGSSHQVKVFSADTGKQLRTIGHRGGPQLGAYDEQRMAHPMGMTIDSNGVLWVAEEDYLPKRISRWDAKTGRFLNAWYGPTQYGGGGFADPHDLYRAYYPSIGNPGSMGLLEFRVDPATGSSRLTAVRYRFPDPLNDIISYGGYAPKPIFFPNDMIPAGSHGGITPAQTFYRGDHQYFTDSYNTYWYNQTTVTTLWILEDGICRPIASAGWVGSGPHHWTTLDQPEIRRRIPAGDPDQTFFVWTDRNHDHAVQADEVQFSRPAVPGSAGVVFQPDLSVISGGPYHLPTASIDAAGVPSYDLSKLALVSNSPVTGEVALSPDGWFLAGMSGYKDGHLRWTLSTRSSSVPPSGPGDIQDPKRMLGYPVRPAAGEAGYLVARYSYMGEIYIYTVDGLLVATLGGDTRLSPFWPYPQQKLGMEITGLSFDAEQFWPFMFGNDDGNVYVAIGKWHTSVVRLDGLDSIQRVDLGSIVVSKDELDETAPLRVESLSRERLKTEVDVHHLDASPSASPESWPAKDWAAIDKNSSFQLDTDGKNLIVAYRTNQPDLLRNSATEFPFAFTQGGGLDLMVRASGSSDDRHVATGDARIFVTRRNGKLLAVLYRQKTDKPGNRVTFASPIGEVVFDDVEDISDRVALTSNNGFYQLSVPLSLLGLEPSPGKQYRGDVGLVLSDGTRAQARVYWHNKADAMTADVPSEARLNPSQWGIFRF
ncbi:hypothetical protein ACFPT7_13495 [Acidicapsa dinghuensis]|uniref:FlgD Ig-like domain-containing protein n=1 Tax=Acidicapsa dinghuensis TaxID=2218256 RepID=A0ABW1EGU4_9BACT|nr:hypothetical protein [Acidicapsa dinghuensis]